MVKICVYGGTLYREQLKWIADQIRGLNEFSWGRSQSRCERGSRVRAYRYNDTMKLLNRLRMATKGLCISCMYS